MADTTTTQPTEADGRFEIVSRLAQYPIINSAATTAMSYYEGAKEYNPTIKAGLESVEATLGSASHQLEPLVSIADSLACRSLDTVEGGAQKVSGLVEHTKDLVHQTQDLVHAVVDPVKDTIDKKVVTPVMSSIKSTGYATSGLLSPTEMVGSAVEFAHDVVEDSRVGGILKSTVGMVDRCVDTLLPSGDAASSSSSAAYSGSLLDRSIKVQQKVQTRMSMEAMLNMPVLAIKGIMDLTPFGNYTAQIMATTAEQVQTMKDVAHNTTDRIQKLKEAIQDEALQRTELLTKRTDEFTKRTIVSIHQVYDHLFAIMLNIMVLLNQKSVDITGHIQGIQTLGRVISESKDALGDKVQHSDLVNRLRSDSRRVLLVANDLLPKDQETLAGLVNVETLRSALTSLEDVLGRLLGSEAPAAK
eukprot:TRINITY_DN1408_c0_g1_i1.p1 TRINITY_DN1408_c0_g1~~TRINITY_DN1408_c0_g1_i1.p1  ORF type:complete len:416 (-),score=144.47 TRINITY_DN1408_c0_g1_i1:228-1475(-)